MLATATKTTWHDVLVRLAAGEPIAGAEMAALPGFDWPVEDDYYVAGDSVVFELLLTACCLAADAFDEDHGVWVNQAVLLDEALVEACPDRFDERPELRLLAIELGMQVDFAAGLRKCGAET